jgi:hypothetical protein
MASTLQVRPLPNQNPQDEDLQTIASQMHQKFKGFRHITEQGLLDSADKDGLEPMDIMPGLESETTVVVKPEEQKGTLEFIAANRATMMQQVG